MSRPSLGVEHVEKLIADREAKTRLKVVLRALAGEISVNDAAQEIGVGLSRFHELRDEALAGALEALGPKVPGRPPGGLGAQRKVKELEAELDSLRYQLEAERVRSELLLSIPEVIMGKRMPPRMERGARGGGGWRTRS